MTKNRLAGTRHPETIAAQAGGMAAPETGAVVPPIDISTTYERGPDKSYPRGFAYGRADNATVQRAEGVIAGLEGAAGALLFGSGMAAATSLFLGLAPGAHIVASRQMYWALRRWLLDDAQHLGLRVDMVESENPQVLAAAIRPGETRLVWIETPANPLWGVSDIAAVSDIAHRAGAQLAVDSTVATPVLTRPLALGADIVMHSASKYLNGHSDVIAGALAFADSGEAYERAQRQRSSLGGILAPFEAAMLLRGLRTLHIRVRHQSESALWLAERLRGHKKVSAVLYPGLADAAGHDIAARQMSGGFGGMLSLRIAGGERAAVAVAAGVEIWHRATSLGGVESLIEHRASIEGVGTLCPPDLLRLSVGLEDREDLAGDLERALARV